MAIVTFLRLVLVSVVSRLRWFRFYSFSFAFGVGSYRGFGGFASSFLVFFCAVVSCLCLVIRVCRTATTLLNELCFIVERKGRENANLAPTDYRV